jgi:hypothetical protein
LPLCSIIDGGQYPTSFFINGVESARVNEALLPNDRTVGCLQTRQVTFGAKDVNVVAIDGRRAARAARVRDEVVTVVLVTPQLVAGLGVEFEQAFDARQLVTVPGLVGDFACGFLVFEQVNGAVSDRRAGIAVMHGYSPCVVEPLLGERLHQAFDPPNTVTLGPTPLGPFVGRCNA